MSWFYVGIAVVVLVSILIGIAWPKRQPDTTAHEGPTVAIVEEHDHHVPEDPAMHQPLNVAPINNAVPATDVPLPVSPYPLSIIIQAWIDNPCPQQRPVSVAPLLLTYGDQPPPSRYPFSNIHAWWESAATPPPQVMMAGFTGGSPDLSGSA